MNTGVLNFFLVACYVPQITPLGPLLWGMYGKQTFFIIFVISDIYNMCYALCKSSTCTLLLSPPNNPIVRCH